MKFQSALITCFFSAAALIAGDPIPLQNYCPIVVVNNTGLAADAVYFVAHGNDINGFPCFLVPDGDGICQIEYPTASGSPSSAESSRTLSELPLATGTGLSGTAYLLYLPINVSSRGYFSINNPMYLATALNPALGVLGIDDSSVTALTDPNYYTLYQDFEFGLDENFTNSQTLLYLNLSWVDYFCLPMQLAAYSYPSNTQITGSVATPSGTVSTKTREQLIAAIQASLTSNQLASNPSWSYLTIPYYNNPYTDTTAASTVRILAAKNSIDLGASSIQFQGALVPQQFFPSTYASSTTKGPSSGTSFYQAVYTYYLTHTLYAEVFPASLPAVTYAISSVPGQSANSQLQFLSTPSDPSIDVTLNLQDLAMDKLLSGSVWPFEPSSVDAAYTNELSKLISALFTIGQFPFTDRVTTADDPFVNNQADGYADLTYFSNPTGFSNGPWWNVYDKAVHLQLISKGSVPSNSTLGLGYAYDYDDLLNMAGLVNGLVIQDVYGNPSSTTGQSKPYIVITLESLTGTTIPDINANNQAYTVTVGSAANGVAVSFTYYNGTTTTTTPASTTANTSLGSVVVDDSHPFVITFTFDSIDYSYHINLQHQTVTPATTTSTFSAADQYFQGSVVFTITGGTASSPQFTITYNSTPPPWAG